MSTTRRTFLRTAAAAVFGTLAAFYAPRLADGPRGSFPMQDHPSWVNYTATYSNVDRGALIAKMKESWSTLNFRAPLKEIQP